MIPYPDQELDRQIIPAVPDDVLLYGQNAEPLKKMLALLHQIRDSYVRAEQPAPSFFVLANGIDAAFTWQTTQRARGLRLTISNGGLGASPRIGIKVGSAKIPLTTIGNGSTVEINFPYVFDVGVDATLWNLATDTQINGTQCMGIMWYYTEIETLRP